MYGVGTTVSVTAKTVEYEVKDESPIEILPVLVSVLIICFPDSLRNEEYWLLHQLPTSWILLVVLATASDFGRVVDADV